MALHGLGNAEYSLKLIQNGKVYEVVVKDKITITKEKNAASKLSCSILRDKISPEPGNGLAFTLDTQHNQFLGYIVTTHKTGEWCEVEAYDQLYYMNRNKSRFTYENAKASDVAIRLCQDRQYGLLDPPQIADTEYIIPQRIEENVSDLTIITTALDLTFQNTGKRFFIFDDFGSVTIQHDGQMAADCNLLITLGFIESYDYGETLEDAYTAARFEQRIKKDDTDKIEVTTSYWNEGLARYGYLELFDTVEEGENPQTKADQALHNKLPPITTLNLTGVQGDMSVKGGTPIIVDFFTGDRREFIRGWYAVESVTHTIEDGYHYMDLNMSELVRLDEWDNTDPNYYSYPYDVL